MSLNKSAKFHLLIMVVRIVLCYIIYHFLRAIIKGKASYSIHLLASTMDSSGLDVAAASAFSATAAASAYSDYIDIVLTPEEFKAFHNIDRRLYAKLVGLGRDRVQSMHAMALFMWLERGARTNKLVSRLCSLPDDLISSIADEAVLCLKCIENDQPWIVSDTGNDIPTIKGMTNSAINLNFFNSNREKILPGLQHIIDQICLKAFEDIMQQHLVDCKQEGNEQNFIKFSGSVDPRMFSGAVPVSADPDNAVYFVPGVGYYTYKPAKKTEASASVDPIVGEASPPPSPSPSPVDAVNTPELEIMKKSLDREKENVLDHLLLDHPQDDAEVPIDAKTIFLTFSKGYPISEEEIRNFFNRKFGDIIEALHMQEVPRKKQPLYARLIVNRLSDMDVVLGGTGRIKFSINGKHLLARKFFSKKLLPSSKAASPSSSPPSQA